MNISIQKVANGWMVRQEATGDQIYLVNYNATYVFATGEEVADWVKSRLVLERIEPTPDPSQGVSKAAISGSGLAVLGSWQGLGQVQPTLRKP